MLNYIKKMKVEKTDLEGKIKKAVKALSNESEIHLDKTQAVLLQDQIEKMREYNSILKKRIEYEIALHGE